MAETEQPETQTEEQTQPEEATIPEEWKELNIGDKIDKGWRLRIKTAGDRSYITIRKGNKEKSLGAYTEEKWNLLMKLYPVVKAAPETPKKSKTSLTTMTLKKPAPLKPSSNISIETLAWYEWLQSRGYEGSFGDFVNEIVHDYFKREGLERPVVIMRE